MNPVYKKWIDDHIPDKMSAYGNCHIFCNKMRREFPELILVRGWYKDPAYNKKQTHFWLETKDGEVVDPTIKQFPTQGNFYIKYNLS